MMPASNNGAGQNIGFPDVCLTPAAPAPIPLPYPNIAMNAMAVPFSPNIFVGFMPSLNMASKIPMTNGDEAGVAHPLFKMMGQYTMGNPTILVNCVPAANMLVPTTGNMFNNPIGAALVPCVTTTFYTDRLAAEEVGGLERDDEVPTIDAAALDMLADVSRGVTRADVGEVEAHRVAVDTVVVTIRRFSAVTATRVYSELRRLDAHETAGLVFDLRGNPGGDTDGCLALLDDLLPPSTVMLLRQEDDGDCTEIRARQPRAYVGPVTVVVDRSSASAAEIFAAALQAHGRARIVGEPSAGKSTAQRLARAGERLQPVYATVAVYLRHDGEPIDGCGVTPDAELDAELAEMLRP